jgi:hypothetical protein
MAKERNWTVEQGGEIHKAGATIEESSKNI